MGGFAEMTKNLLTRLISGRSLSLSSSTNDNNRPPRILGIFASWRLQAYGFALAAVYAVLLLHFYLAGAWIIDRAGMPVYSDFTDVWVAGVAALRGKAALIYEPGEFTRIQSALLGPRDFFYPNWPYPPTFLLILAALGALAYFYAFAFWDITTLLACIVVVYAIVRRRPAIALMLASPYTLWNFLAGQNGFLTASLIGASLLSLERRPVLAGVFIGCLSYKPQFGILFPVALAASSQWRALASAATTTALLAGASIVAFGSAPWLAFPRGLVTQGSLNFLANPDSNWGLLQTVYGLVRYLGGGPALAFFAQGITTAGLGLIVWLVWRSEVRYALKATTLSAAALIATPYAFAYDLAAIAIPIAFLARDQMRFGLLRGEQMILFALFGTVLAVLVIFADRPVGTTFAAVPFGPFVVITLLGVALHRAFRRGGPEKFPKIFVRRLSLPAIDL
jgi:arabinofuranan 3-O-arabinosyltransferase